eukprot:2189855-Alexandrium_andersonii.AAC.1
MGVAVLHGTVPAQLLGDSGRPLRRQQARDRPTSCAARAACGSGPLHLLRALNVRTRPRVVGS